MSGRNDECKKELKTDSPFDGLSHDAWQHLLCRYDGHHSLTADRNEVILAWSGEGIAWRGVGRG